MAQKKAQTKKKPVNAPKTKKRSPVNVVKGKPVPKKQTPKRVPKPASKKAQARKTVKYTPPTRDVREAKVAYRTEPQKKQPKPAPKKATPKVKITKETKPRAKPKAKRAPRIPAVQKSERIMGTIARLQQPDLPKIRQYPKTKSELKVAIREKMAGASVRDRAEVEHLMKYMPKSVLEKVRKKVTVGDGGTVTW